MRCYANAPIRGVRPAGEAAATREIMTAVLCRLPANVRPFASAAVAYGAQPLRVRQQLRGDSNAPW